MKKFINIEKTLISCLALYFSLKYKIVLATTSPGSTGLIKIGNPLRSGTNTLQDFIELIIKQVILPVGGVIAVIYIIYAGFLLVTAQGNETKLAEAKRAFLYAAIGTMVLLGAWVIAEAIGGTIDQITG